MRIIDLSVKERTKNLFSTRFTARESETVNGLFFEMPFLMVGVPGEGGTIAWSELDIELSRLRAIGYHKVSGT